MYPQTAKCCLLLALLVGVTAWPVSGQQTEDEYQPRPLKVRSSWNPFLRPAQKTPEEQLVYAKELDQAGSHRALKQYRALAHKWPQSAEAPEAQRRFADLLYERGKKMKAYDEYEYLMERYAGQFTHYDEIVGRQFEIAVWLMGKRKGKFLFLPGFYAPERAIPLLESVIKHGPSLEHAPEAQYLIGKIQQDIDHYEEAITSYETGMHRYPQSSVAEKCAYGRAYCLYLLALESPNSDEAVRQAWSALSLFIQTYPASELQPVAEEYKKTLYRQMARSAYEQALFYENVARKPESALVAYRQFVRDFPNSEWTGVAEIRIDALTGIVDN